MPFVVVPEPYRGPTRGLGEVQVEASDVMEAILAVEAAYPGFRDLVLDAEGALHRFVKLFVNDDRSLGDEDRLGVLAAIAGGE